MLGIHVTVPIACFRKGLAREYLETEQLPPPATCYGFLLSLVGETQRDRHIGSRISPVLLNEPQQSVVLRTVWRVKSKPLGASGNTRPDYQQLLSPIELVLWLDSRDEQSSQSLEARVKEIVVQKNYSAVSRFGGLSLGESTHLVNDVSHFVEDKERRGRAFVLHPRGRLTLPVWVDHVGSAGTNFVTGNLQDGSLAIPNIDDMPCIRPRQDI
jgi:CRISPR-associated protein Cas5t